MPLAIYTRDRGIITFQGEQEWDSVEQMLEYYCRAEESPDQETLTGWGHPAVTWYGDTGVAQ